jgi:cob(I)alamin adenosyltransferase
MQSITDYAAKDFRINNGLCQSGMGIPRLTTTYKEGGLGNSSQSELSKGNRVSKHDPSYGIHVAAEQVRLAISNILINNELLSSDEQYVMDWIRSSTFSVSSFCFCMGDSTRHLYPRNFLLYMERNIRHMKDDIGGAQDFLIWNSVNTIKWDTIRVVVRELERAYIEWSVLNNSSINSSDLSNVSFMGDVINRMSSYVLWLTRSIAKREGTQEEYWSGQMEEFNP